MRHRLASLALAAATAALTGACDVAAMGPQERQQVNETRRLDAQGTFTLENTNGTVVIETWSESSVSIEAEKVAPESQLDDLRVEIKGEGGRVDVTTRFPRGWGRHGHVDYRVKVPRDARVEVETTNGAVKVLGAGGSVRATTTNGSVDVAEAGGSVEASTTNGSIRAGFREAPSTGTQRLSTTNGSVTLTLPADASGDFSASTVNGGISSDFPLEVSGRFGGRKLHGRLGDGQARFELSTVNGAVKILRRSGA